MMILRIKHSCYDLESASLDLPKENSEVLGNFILCDVQHPQSPWTGTFFLNIMTNPYLHLIYYNLYT